MIVNGASNTDVGSVGSASGNTVDTLLTSVLSPVTVKPARKVCASLI